MTAVDGQVAGVAAARRAAEPDRRARRRTVRPIRSRRSAADRLVAGERDGPLAPSAQPAPGAEPPRQAHRPAGDHEASRATGWEAVVLARTRARRGPGGSCCMCDVSRSMQPYAAIYLHLMRAAALRQAGIRPEVFAFSTSLTRLTAVLSHRSAEVALARANAKVVDRYGGTHLGRCVGDLLSPPHGNALRGAVVIIASDGWDSDPPDVLEHALAGSSAAPRCSSGSTRARRSPGSSRWPGRCPPHCRTAICSCRRTR